MFPQSTCANDSQGVRDAGETRFILEKLAVIIGDIAKREWLLSWMDFDDVLQSMWSTHQTTRTIALKVLTELIEDVFLNDDPIAGLRSPLLTAGLMTIMASSDVVTAYYDANPLAIVHGVGSKPNQQGWLNKLSKELLTGDETQALSILQVLRVTLSWIITTAAIEAQIMQRVCNALMSQNVQIRTCAVDCLYIMLTRPLQPQDPFLAEIYTLYEPASLMALTQVWQRTSDSLRFVGGTLTDDESYTMLKKLTETIVALACFKFGSSQAMQMEDIKLSGILDLVMLTWQHNSLMISGMSNNFWCSLLRDDRLNNHPDVSEKLVEMLQIASARLLNFEDARVVMLKGSEIQMYLDLDLENLPELHAFCSNYMRFAFDIARMVVFKEPRDATAWMRAQVSSFFTREYVDMRSGHVTKTSPMFISAQTKFCQVDACLRGVLRIMERQNPAAVTSEHTLSGDELEKERLQLLEVEEMLVSWCEEFISLQIKEPLVLARQISTLVAFSVFLKHRTDILFKVLEKVIETATYFYAPEIADSSMTSIRELRGRCGVELLRLGSTLPDQLWEIYPQLENTVNTILCKQSVSESEQTIFNALLLAISQRAKATDEAIKTQEFGKVLSKVIQVWNTPDIYNALLSFESFAKTLVIDQVSMYLAARQITEASQLDNIPLDVEGRSLLATIKAARKWTWPIRASRKFVEVTLDTAQPLKDLERALWKDPIVELIPNILRLLERISAYYNQSNWQQLPLEMRLIAKESIQERFWLHGVSQVTRDEFLEATTKASNSCRELVHTIGHFLRRTREYCLITLGTFSMLEHSFYGINGIGDMLMHAFFSDNAGTSLHVWSTMITQCLRHVVLNCPPEHFSTVLATIMTSFPHIVLVKLRSEWGKLMERGALQTKEEETEDQEGKADLSDEMMEESLLRHLSYAVVKLMSDLLVPPVTTLRTDRAAVGSGRSPMSDWLLKQQDIVGGIMLLLSFCLTINDTRTAIHAAKILRAITPVLMEIEELQRYVCHEVFSATIRCIHDSYFVAIQTDLINLLAHIYFLSLGKSTLPREILLSIPQMANDVGTVKQFEDKLANAKTDRTRRSLMHELLINHEIVGQEGYGRGSATKIKLGADVTTKEVIKRFQASVTLRQEQEKHQNVLVREEESGINNLFD